MRFLLVSVLCLSVFQSAYAAEKLTMGVVPQQSPLKLFKTWKPIADYLSEKTGAKIIFKTEKSIAKFEKVLYNGGYDLAYMNPYHFVIANRRAGYQAGIRANKMIRGILVSKDEQASFDTLVKEPTTKYIFPSPNAFAATLLTKYELLDKYGVNINEQAHYKYVNSHDSVYLGVARGTGQVGGGIQRTFNNFDKNKDKDHLKVLYTTDAYPSHPIAYRPEMSSELQQKLTTALLEIPDELIKRLSIKKFIPIANEEYESVRKLEEKLSIVER